MTGDTGTNGSATIPAPTGVGYPSYPTPDLLIEEDEVFYGALEPGENVAALYVWCSNTGDTADGQIQNSLVIYTWDSGQLTVLGTLVPPQLSNNGVHAPSFDGSRGGITMSKGTVTTGVLFSGPQDAVCCPSGRATTTWTYNDHTFSPTTTIQTQPAGNSPLARTNGA